MKKHTFACHRDSVQRRISLYRFLPFLWKGPVRGLLLVLVSFSAHAQYTLLPVAGNDSAGYYGEGVPARHASLYYPGSICRDSVGNLYFGDGAGGGVPKYKRVRRIDATTGVMTTVAGNGSTALSADSVDNAPATTAGLKTLAGICIDRQGNLLIADGYNRIRKVTMSTGTISTVAGNIMLPMGYSGDGGPATAAQFKNAADIAVDRANNFYFLDGGAPSVRKVNAVTSIITTVAGTGIAGFSGDGGPATIAQLYYPKAIAVDAGGNVYIADWNNHAVRKINSVGIINTIAGTGTAGYSGDGGPAVSAQLNYPTGVAVRYDGDVFISDNDNNRVRRIKIGNEPYFSEGASKSVTTCPVELISLDTMLSVDDIDVGQTLTWSPLRLPAHGTLVASCTAPSTSSTVVPPCGSYVLTTGYVGTDTFSVRVNDGTYSDTIEFYVNIVGFPNPGAIAGSDSVCPGHNITLTNSYAGGVWSSTATGVATVSSAGVVTGVSAGVTTVSYTATNTCGTVVVTKIIYVPSTIPCIAGVTGAALATPKTRIVQGPDSGQFTVYLDGAAEAPMDVTVFDVSGRKVFSGSAASKNQLSFRLSYPDGLYVIKIQHLGRQYVVKTTLHK